MNNIPTAEEFCKSFKPTGKTWQENFHQTVIEFAKLNVEAALEAASKASKLLVINTEEHREIKDGEDLLDEYECGSDVIHISASSILDSYPLTNIK
jgi:hypothetical protein